MPILVAADRSGTTLSAALPEVSAKAIQAVLEPAIDKDALLVTDGAAAYPRCAADIGISHEALNQSAGERVRGDLHIQTVNNRHQRLKSFLAPFRGIATKYLPNYLRWFLCIGLAPHPHHAPASMPPSAYNPQSLCLVNENCAIRFGRFSFSPLRRRMPGDERRIRYGQRRRRE